jgi:predicted Zn-dependent protease
MSSKSSSTRLQRWRRAALAAALTASAATFPAQAQLPSLGDAGDLSVGSERRMGEKIARELFRDPDFIEDPVLDEYVLEIWTKLLAAARRRGELGSDIDDRFAWEVLLGKDRTINAFALPGGWMGLHLGLISATVSRDEVASVLAHELSHVTQRHISRLSEQQSRQMPLILGAMVLGALAASKNPDAAQAAIVGGQAMAMQNQINFTRDMEREADRIGMGVATEAGFDPQGFIGMFEKLQQASRHNDSGAFPYLRTHPLNTERIAEMRSRLQLAPRPAAGEADVLHAMMAARARVLSNPGVDLLRAYVGDDALKGGAPRAREAGALYAAALASAKLRDPAAAARFARRLSDLVANDPAQARQANLLLAEVSMEAGDPVRAAALADTGGDRRPELILSSQALLKSGKPAPVSSRLQSWVPLHPRDAEAWLLLSQAYTAERQTLRALRAEAESYVARLDYAAALDRFRAAQEASRRMGSARDHIEAQIIDARARQVASLLREQALER